MLSKKIKSYCCYCSSNKAWIIFFHYFVITLGPKVDQVQMMMHYNGITKFLQMLKTNLFGMEMNFTVMYRVTGYFIDNKKTSMITFGYIFALVK